MRDACRLLELNLRVRARNNSELLPKPLRNEEVLIDFEIGGNFEIGGLCLVELLPPEVSIGGMCKTLFLRARLVDDRIDRFFNFGRLLVLLTLAERFIRLIVFTS